MLVSVICLCFNHADTLTQAFNSVTGQVITEKIDLDVIIIDDNSSDESALLLKKLVDSTSLNIRLVIHEENIGGSASLVEGFRMAKGDLITVLEMDDFWHNSVRLLSAVEFLNSHSNVFAINDGIRRVHNKKYDSTGSYSNWNGKSFAQRYYKMSDWQDCSYPGHISALTFRNFTNKTFGENFLELIRFSHRNVSDITLVYILLMCGDFICRDNVVSTYRVVSAYNKTNYTSQIKGKNANLDRNIHLAKIQEFHRTHFKEYLPIERDLNSILAESVLLLLRYPSVHNLRTLVALYSMGHQLNEGPTRFYLVISHMIKMVWRRIF